MNEFVSSYYARIFVAFCVCSSAHVVAEDGAYLRHARNLRRAKRPCTSRDTRATSKKTTTNFMRTLAFMRARFYAICDELEKVCV